MSDDWADAPVEDDNDDEARRVPRSWTDPAAAPSVLRAAAILALVMWVIGFVSSMWFQFDGMGSIGGQQGPSRLLGAVASGFTATWGYLLVAVIAFTSATIVGAPRTQATNRSAT